MNTMKRILLCLALLVAVGVAEDTERKVARRVDPDYPELAKTMNIHGTVKLRAWILPDGTVRRVEYIGGHPVLADSSVSAVKKWKFEAASKETSEVIEFKF